MKTKNIDILNIGLILISLLIAIYLPFELFLFSYAFLGPLHYLTQINWLRDRNYFIKSKTNWTIAFIVMAIFMAIYPAIKFMDLNLSDTLNNLMSYISQNANTLLITGFLFAVTLIFFKKTKYLLIGFVLSISIAIVLNTGVPEYVIFVGIFLPTLVHVYIFTLLFIFYGALKAKSKYGIYLGITLLIVPLIICYLPIDFLKKDPTQETLDTFVSSNMIYVSSTVARMLGGLHDGKFYALSDIGIRIQIFIAFAYTYHYLNWFSKISIIGWKKNITKKKGISILAIWILSVALYIYDFKTGFIALLFLSFLHVFLEFPLNVITIKELFRFSKRKQA